MPSKEERRKAAEKHIGLIRGVFAKQVKASLDAAIVYEDGDGRSLDVPEARFETTQVRIAQTGAERAVVQAKGNAAVVDPASYRRPGSGYANGAATVEAMLCASSSLYPVLEGLKERFYDVNRDDTRGELYSDRAVFLPDIVFTEGSVVHRAVVVCAPPDKNRALEHHRPQAEIEGDLAHRVETVMRVAAANGVDTLVVPPFGCGALGNDPALVAQLFKEWIEAHPGVFEEVVFAIPRGAFSDAFASVIGDADENAKAAAQAAAAEKSAEADAEDDEDDEDWRNYMTSGE